MVGGFQFISAPRRSPGGAARAIRVGLLAAAAVAGVVAVALAVALAGSGFASTVSGIGRVASPLAPTRLPAVAAPPATAAPRASDPMAAPPPPSTPPSQTSPGTPVAPADEAQVSMSALGAPPTARSGNGRRAHDVPDDFPLTRAAARQRIESMSPAGWLAHYGAVSIDRHE